MNENSTKNFVVSPVGAPVCVSLLQNELLSKPHVNVHVKNISLLKQCLFILKTGLELYLSS
jgi:hypothetical protein